MIKTFYTDRVQVRQLAHDFANDDKALRAAATLDDMGLSICNHQEEFNKLCEIVPVHLWLGGWQCEEWFLVLHNRIDDLLPETRR